MPGGGWTLVEVRSGHQPCDRCGHMIESLFVIRDPRGVEKVVGSVCVWIKLGEKKARKFGVRKPNRRTKYEHVTVWYG